MQFCDIRITKHPLDAAPLRFSRTEGAVVDFFGVVRTIENERMIDGIAEHSEQSSDLTTHPDTCLARPRGCTTRPS